MSARPDLRRLSDEELDLLISRHIDGDLSPDEERQLEQLLATDARARERQAALQSVADALKRLPTPEPPFGLASRVSSGVLEGSRGVGSLWHRFGIYPPPGLVLASTGVLALVLGAGVYFTSLGRPRPVQTAQHLAPREDGPVRVFLAEGQDASKDAASSAAKEAAKEAPPPVAQPAPASPAAEGEPAPARGPLLAKTRSSVGEKAEAERFKGKQQERREEAPGKKDLADDERLAEQRSARSEADALSAAPRPAGSVAGFAPEPPARDRAAAQPALEGRRDQAGTATLSIVTRPASWRLATPLRASLGTPVAARYRLALDGEGRVLSVTPLPPRGPERRDVEALLEGLRFTRLPGTPESRELEVEVVSR